MRILLVSQEMPPETGWGGIGTYVDVLSRALAAKGADVHVLSLVDQQQRSVTDVDGVTVHRLALPRVWRPAEYAPESWRRLVQAAAVARCVPRLGVHPDVVECPEWMAEGLGLALRGSVPLVVRMHSSARQLFRYNGQGSQLRGLDGRLAARLEEISVRRANLVVSTRSNLDDVAIRLGLDDRGLRRISYPVRLPQPMPMPDGGSRVTFLGRFEGRKGPEIALRAAPWVLAELPETTFAFVGRDGTVPGAPSSAAWLREEAQRLGIVDAIEIREAFGRSVVEDELRRTNVCVVPSRWESFGYTVAEASAAGRPVVASTIPPFRELVADGVTGFLAPLDSPEAWAIALVALLRDRKRARAMGEAGAAHVAAISDPSVVADRAMAAYEDARARWERGERAGRGRLTSTSIRRCRRG
jgi:glycosyltransferase involved in cell wall biosynthesis